MRRFQFFASVVTLAAPFAGATASAQLVQTIAPANHDADALAAAMRRLGDNPRDLDALLTGGELSLRLGDASGAASLFKRAEQVDPANGRVKAGMASILVRAERPGEALRYFGQAEGFGYDSRRFAADRALAFDLIGEQARAQRDYRTALKDARDDETVRRYALSLGISGKQDAALEQIDTLLRKNDRGAWRARAFILAMTGDVPGASRIASSMIPGMAQALQPFFVRLASLGPVDRAFAVHFGEIGATTERLADARLIPALAPLPAELVAAPVLVATVQVTAKSAKKARRERRRRGSLDRVEVAAAAPKIATLPPPPGFGSTGASPTDPVRVVAAPAQATPTPRPVTPTQVASATPTRSRRTVREEPLRYAMLAGSQRTARAVGGTLAAPTRARAPSATTATTAPTATATAAPFVVPTPVPAVIVLPSPVAVVTALPYDVPTPTPAVIVLPPSVAVASSGPVSPPIRPTTAALPAPPRMSEDSILARIIAGIAVPGSELETSPGPQVSATAAPVAAPPVVDPAAVAKRQAEERAALVATKAAADRKALAEKKAADAKAVAIKKAADAKALAAKMAAADKALAAKQAADEKKAAKADPARVWVQVSGGAYAGDLRKAWAAVKAKSPALAARQGYSTPLRATNRVVTGPFRTNEEAQAFVNTLAKQGVSAFTFTSSVGQKVAKLPAK